MAVYPGGNGVGGHGGNGGGHYHRRPPPHPTLRDSWIHGIPQGHNLPPIPHPDHEEAWTTPIRHVEDLETYESIYDSRWRLLNQVRPQLVIWNSLLSALLFSISSRFFSRFFLGDSHL